MMASFDCFEINLSGKATHAAMPHLGCDVLVAAAHLITQLQTIVSRQIDPADAAVVSITQIHGGNTWNALPDSAVVRGTFRSFKNSVRPQLDQSSSHLAQSVAQGFSLHAEVCFNPENPGYPVTVNSPDETASAIRAAIEVAGADCVNTAPTPAWVPRISLLCCSRNRVVISGLVMAVRKVIVCCIIRITILTMRSCRLVPHIGLSWWRMSCLGKIESSHRIDLSLR